MRLILRSLRFTAIATISSALRLKVFATSGTLGAGVDHFEVVLDWWRAAYNAVPAGNTSRLPLHRQIPGVVASHAGHRLCPWRVHQLLQQAAGYRSLPNTASRRVFCPLFPVLRLFCFLPFRRILNCGHDLDDVGVQSSRKKPPAWRFIRMALVHRKNSQPAAHLPIFTTLICQPFIGSSSALNLTLQRRIPVVAVGFQRR